MFQFCFCQCNGNGRWQRTLGPSVCYEVGEKTDSCTEMDGMQRCQRGRYAASLVLSWFIDFIRLSHGRDLGRNTEYSAISGVSFQSADFMVFDVDST